MNSNPAFKTLLSDVAANCLCRRVQHASRTIGKRFDEAFRPVGLNNWQFTMLMALAHAASQTINQIAGELGMDRTTTTKNLRPLERRGLVTIRTDDKDARVRRVSLTEEGRQLLEDALARWRSVNEEVSAGLSKEQLVVVRSALDVIAAN